MMYDVSLGLHRIEQRHDIDSRIPQSLGRLGIRHLVNSAFDLGHQKQALRRISQLAREHVHEGVNLPRRGFQLVTIESVAMEVHERIACLRKARAQGSQVSQNLRCCGTR
jgi:hypothetical protein